MTAVILPLQVQAAPDNEEQAKMREALRRMIEQSTPSETAPASATKPVKAATPPPAPKPAPAPVAPTPTVVAPPPTKVVPVEVIPPPAAPAATTAAFESVPPPDDPATIARAREAMRQKILEMQATQPTLVAPAPVKPASGVQPAQLAVVAPSSTATSVKKMPAGAPIEAQAFTPIQGPASPLSGSKQAKLAELLSRYRADAITAQEYHTQRAAIIAEP